MATLIALQGLEAVQPGSVMVRLAQLRRVVILIGQDLLESAISKES